MTDQSRLLGLPMQAWGSFNPFQEYWTDAWQRSILFLDVLRQRGNIAREHNARRRPERAELHPRTRAGRAHLRAAGELRPGAHRAAGGHHDRPRQAAVHRLRPARRARPGHRRHEARQRDRHGPAGRPSLLFRRLPAQPHAGPDGRGRLPRRGELRRGGGGAPPCRRRQAGADRQLPGRLADHDDGGAAAGTRRPDHAGRIAAVLLGRRARQEPDALSRRRARRHLADRAHRRPRQRHLRRRPPDRQFRIRQPGQHLLEEALRRLFQGRYRGAAVPRIRDLVGQPGAAQRRGDAVDRRQSVRRQPAGHRRVARLRRHAHRPAQHPLADHRVLLLGRRHHPAAAGARLDHRPL